jgi:hypothetical protein
MCTGVLIGWNLATLPSYSPRSYTRALLVSQERRHLFVTPWCCLLSVAFWNSGHLLYRTAATQPQAMLQNNDDPFVRTWDHLSTKNHLFSTFLYTCFLTESGSDWCIPRNETVRPHYFQNIIMLFCLPISTFMYLWAIYIFPQSVCRGPIMIREIK